MLTHTNADKYISMLIQTDTCSMLKHTHKRTHTHAHTCLFSMQTFLSSCSYLCRRAGIQHVLHSREGGGQSIQRTGEAGMLCLHVCVCMYLRVNVYVCMYSVLGRQLCVSVCVCLYVFESMYVCMCVCVCTAHWGGRYAVSACDVACAFVHGVCVCTCLFMCAYVCICECMSGRVFVF
jgi:cytochrome c oxidase subunit IV